tara:strand:- start:465 stop:632 length:168 start_codon:yes stop_codon:yes gene_type:complete
MSKPNLQEIHVSLEKHIAISNERWIETINRIKRLEAIMISTAAASLLLLVSIIIK